MSQWSHIHVHSRYSRLDGMTTVQALVERAAHNKQPALGLSDHGSMAGAVQLYRQCKAHDIMPFIGFEGYLLDPERDLDEPHAGRYHFGVYALDQPGYTGLVKAMSLSHTRPRFSRFPRLTLEDVLELGSEYGEHLALITGCYFGLVQQVLVNEGEQEALGCIKIYASVFPNTYVEVQNHNIDHGGITDDELVKVLISLADEADLPVLITNDAHYCLQKQRAMHALMKRMTYGGVDDEFPGDSFHLASTEWVQEHYSADQWDRGLEGNSDLLGKHRLSLAPLDTFKAHVPDLYGKQADRRLSRLCYKRLRSRPNRYMGRLNYELGVIRKLGMANYFLLCHRFQQWCESENICIEVRGSANGSLVLYLLGVTTVDPIKWGTGFDRFLTEDRIKPPDVDIDIEDARRDDAVAWLQRAFSGAVAIGTWANLGSRGYDDQGSVVITWKAWKAQQAKEHGQKFKYGWVQTVDDIAQVAPRDAHHLRAIDAMRGPTRDQGVLKSYGMHAAGVLLPSDEVPMRDYVPTMLIANSGNVVTQFDQDDVEEFGFLKLDILGQTSLTVMRRCQELIGRGNPTDFTWIPDDDKDACKLLSEGRTDTGIFHAEGWTKSQGMKRMKVRSTMDSILAVALFMPGSMNPAPGMRYSQTDLYLERRNDAEERRKVTYLHPVFERALKRTYGTVVFQDQVVDIMRGLGMSVQGVNQFIKVVKDSGQGAYERNRERMQSVREEFDTVCRKEGLDPDEVWQQTASFVSYGLNTAHATGYGLRCYRTAYLKSHYPLEYMAALLESWSGTKKEVLYVREARRIGIKILPPDVMLSGPIYTIDRTQRRPSIRKGLLSIKGIGRAAATELAANAPYTDIHDLIERCDARAVSGGKEFTKSGTLTGTLLVLAESGALGSIYDG